jgi:hypothetical protein
MQRRQFVSYVLGCGFIGATACWATGCGTLAHSERRGQPHSNQIDWKIAALDGLGLVLFFVPGVVAFAVDFYTGAIYLPLEESYPGYGGSLQSPPSLSSKQMPSQYSMPSTFTTPVPVAEQQHSPTWQELGLKQVVIAREQLGRPQIEKVATNHVGQPVSLDDSQTRLSKLSGIDQFENQTNRHRSDRSFGLAARSFFERLMRV